MTLCLSSQDLQQVRSCWNVVQTNNKYHKDQFITRLFSNLLAANSDLKIFFKDDVVIREHSILFNDLLNYLIIYLDNIERLNQFLSQFLKENDELVNEINYLEPMGNALIQTFRQWCGKGIFNEKMEQLWVQIYIHLANNILIYTDDDSETSSIEQSDSESIAGLNIVRNQTPPTPASDTMHNKEEEELEEDEKDDFVRPMDLTKKPSLQINIKQNEKYRGFRRNDSNVVEIESSLPKATMPDLVPTRSPKRNNVSNIPIAAPSESLTAKFNNLKPKIVYDSDEEEEESKSGFDPRRLNKRTNSAFHEIIEFDDTPPRPVEKDEKYDIEDIDEKPAELDITLQPIEESSDNEIDVDSVPYNDNSSSIYNSDNSDNSEPSSHDNTLSLHSHYSDGTEGTEPMSLQKVDLRSMTSNESRSDSSIDNHRVFSSSNTYASRQTSISSVEPEFMASVSTKRPMRSQSSLERSIQLSQRASLGFMRSSFVLKKEIETMGFNKPENVFMKPPTIPAAGGSTSLPKSNLVTMLPQSKNNSGIVASSEDESFDLLNSFMPITPSSKAKMGDKRFTSSMTNLSAPQPRSHPHLQKHSRSVSNLSAAKHNSYDPMHSIEATSEIRGSSIQNGKMKSKKSFRDKLRSIFGSNSPKPTPKRTISNPIEMTYSTNSTVPTQSNNSYSEASDKVTGIPKVNSRRFSSKMSSVTDLSSFNDNDNESTSGFSFFDRRRDSTSSRYSTRGDRSKNKYNVSKTPYDVFAHNKLIFSN